MDSTRSKGSRTLSDPRLPAIPDVHGHAKGEHKPFAEERPIAYTPRMLFLWFYHACKRGAPRFMMVSDHINYLTFEDPGAVHTVRRALKLAEAGDLYGAAETAGVDVVHAAVVSQGLRRGMRFSIGAELDNDPRARPDAQNIVDAMRPDGMIRSVHFLTITHPEKGADYAWAFDNPEFKDLYDTIGTERVWELYMTKLIEDVEKLPGHIVAHFYVPAKFGHWPSDKVLERHEDRFLAACAARGIAVEINTRPLYRDRPPEEQTKYRAAIARLLKKAKAKDVGIAIGSDAHSPKDQGNGFSEVLKMLDEAGINEIVFPVAGRLARVALRATKEHLQKVKAQEPQPQAGSSITGFSRAELGLPERTEAEEREAAVLAKTGHDSGPRKRASGSARTTKKPAKAPTERVAKIKAAPKPKAEPKPKPAPKPTPKAAPKTKAKAALKPAPKPAPAKPKAAAKAPAKLLAKPAAKATKKQLPAKKTVKAALKPPAKGKAAAKTPSKAAAKKIQKAPAKKAAAKKAKAPVKKTVAKKPKKTVIKKTTKRR